ncbi:hypothetical protein SNE40_002562 [Patella caerulea]
MYMKRWIRVKTKTGQECMDTPRKKTRKLLRGLRLSKVQLTRKEEREEKKKTTKNVKRTLLYHFALNDALRNKYRKEKGQKKKTLTEIATMKVLQKYQLVTKTKKAMGLSHDQTKRRLSTGSLTGRLFRKIQNFYERDENSQINAGIKETVTKNKVKKQKKSSNERCSAASRKICNRDSRC